MDIEAISKRVAEEVDAAIRSVGTVAAVSASTGIPRTTLIRSLNGQRPFAVDELAAIAVELGTDIPRLAPSLVARQSDTDA